MLKCYFLFGLLFFCPTSSADDDDQDKTQSKLTATNQSLIVLDKASQTLSGLKTVILKPAAYRAERLSYGTAISVEPLVTIQNQYLTALAQERGAQAKLVFSQNRVNRLSYLHQEQIISTRDLQEQQANLQTDKAALTSNYYLKQQIISNAQLLWGEKLSNWAVNASPAFMALLHQQSSLLKIIFPADLHISKPPASIFVAPTANRAQAEIAEFIAIAPQTDAFSQGQHYFYQTRSHAIKAGMRVSAWLPSQQPKQTGVIIPSSAFIWHLGQSLVFVKVGAEQFEHRSVFDYSKTSDGYFVPAQLKAGEEVVVVGAQMLLSQEFRGQIPTETDD